MSTFRSIKHAIPVRKKLRRRLVGRWLLMLALTVIFAAGCILARPNCTQTENRVILLASLGVLWLIAWRIHLIRWTRGREWVGTVIDKESKKTIVKKKNALTSDDLEYTVVCRWTIRRDPPAGHAPDDERDMIYMIYDIGEIGEHYFRRGDRVRWYKNAAYMIKDHPDPRDEDLMCPICGHPTREPICSLCSVDFSDASSPATFEKENAL